MGKKHIPEEQIAFALQQADSGTAAAQQAAAAVREVNAVCEGARLTR